jgi:GNAT superfamily N-acetyltransferase
MNGAVHTFPVEQEEKHVLALLKQVEGCHKALAEGQSDFPELHDYIMQLENLIFSLDQDENRARAILDRVTPEMVVALNGAYRAWETMLECQFAEQLIQGDASLSDYLLYERLGALAKRELALVPGAPQRILFVGSGPLPLCAIHMHLQTGSPLDCVARDHEAAVISRQVVERCNLSAAIRVFEEETEHSVSDYDLILVGLVKNKKAILKNLRKRCRPACPILCRTSDGLRQILCEATSDHDLRGFYRKGQQLAKGEQTISTQLLEAAGSAAAKVRMEWLRGIDSHLASQILRLMNRTLEEETTIGFPGPIDDETGYALLRQLNSDLETGHRYVLIAEKDGEVVGQLIMTPNSSPNHRHIVELTRGIIDPSFRGGGLALRAFEEVARKCEELGREVICLDVRAGTMAAMWWQHFGFKPFGLLPDYSRVGNKKYQGLYLTQTTADLKQSLKEIARAERTRTLSLRRAH